MSAARRKMKSPVWKNPRDMIKRHLKRKSSRCLMSEALASSSSSISVDASAASEPPLKFGSYSTRSNNPFKHSSPLKRSRTCDDKENTDLISWEADNALLEFPSGVFDSIKNSEKASGEKSRGSIRSLKSGDFPPVDFSSFTSFRSFSKDSFGSKSELIEQRTSKSLPADLRLGTKLRIESKKPFPWMRNEDLPGNYHIRVTGLEMDAAIQLLHSDSETTRQHEDSYFPILEITPIARLEASTMYWQFPNIPWMTMFPRLDAARKYAGIKKEKTRSLLSLGKDFVESVNSQWVAAFNHLFFSWKKGTRSHFYLCCSAFTVLFAKSFKDSCTEIDESSCSQSSWANNSVLSVVITPTTSGFRQQLREEEINFELPLRLSNSRRSSREQGLIFFGLDSESSVLNEATQSSLMSEATKSDSRTTALATPEKKIRTANGDDVNADSDGEQDISGDSDHATWLQDIGVSPKSTRRMTKNFSMSSLNERSLMDSAMADASQHSGGYSSSPADVGKSVVVITEPSSIQALFNFLNDSKACHPTTGPTAGLPPTLLSSEPFLHSELKNLTVGILWHTNSEIFATKSSSGRRMKVNQDVHAVEAAVVFRFSQIVKSDRGELKYVCELSNGPIMPHMLSQLRGFFTSCTALNAPENRVKVNVNGRNFCAAMNQAANVDSSSDYTSFEYAVNEGLYYLK